MEELMMTPSTWALLAVIAAAAALAVRRLVRRGMCDCGDHCEGGCEHCPKGCKSGGACSAVDDMAAKLEAMRCA